MQSILHSQTSSGRSLFRRRYFRSVKGHKKTASRRFGKRRNDILKEKDDEGMVDAAKGIEGLQLVYFPNRFLDPEIARWIGPDPAGQTHAMYDYCGGNPINLVDPDGAYFKEETVTPDAEEAMSDITIFGTDKQFQQMLDLELSPEAYSFKADANLSAPAQYTGSQNPDLGGTFAYQPSNLTGDLLVHEMTHADQHLTGSLSFNAQGYAINPSVSKHELPAVTQQSIFYLNQYRALPPSGSTLNKFITTAPEKRLDYLWKQYKNTGIPYSK